MYDPIAGEGEIRRDADGRLREHTAGVHRSLQGRKPGQGDHQVLAK